MKSVPLTVYPRGVSRRKETRKIRANGRVPAVIYGGQTEPQKLEIIGPELDKLIHSSVSENLLVDLEVAQDKRPKRLVLVQAVQHHPLSGKVLHVDFHEVSETERVVITVPVETTGEAAGVKNSGGILEHVLFKIKIRALPKDLPEFIQIDVSHLEIGQSIHLGDIKPPEGAEIIGDRNIPVVSVAMPRTEAQEAAALAGGATADTLEVIKEKKEDGAPAAADAKAGDKAGGAKAADKGAAPAKGAADKAAPAAKGKK